MCIASKILIQTQKGLLRLEELGNIEGDNSQHIVGFEVFTDSPKQKVKINEFLVGGYGPTIKFRLRSGIELEISPDHKLRIMDSDSNYIWKTAREICLGDQMACILGDGPIYLPTHFFSLDELDEDAMDVTMVPTHIIPSIYYLLGSLLLYGTVTQDRVQFTFTGEIADFKKAKVLHVLKEWTDDSIMSFILEKEQISTEGNVVMIGSPLFVKFISTLCIQEEISLWFRTSKHDYLSQFFSAILKPKDATELPTFQILQDLLVIGRSIGINAVGYTTPDGKYFIDKDTSMNQKWHDFTMDPVVYIQNDIQNYRYDIRSETDAYHYRIASAVSYVNERESEN